MNSPAARWEECQDWMEQYETAGSPNEPSIMFTRHFAINEEGDAIWFDENWVPLFLVTDAEGTIRAMNPTGETEDIYCEPVWLSGWFEWAYEKFGTD